MGFLDLYYPLMPVVIWTLAHTEKTKRVVIHGTIP